MWASVDTSVCVCACVCVCVHCPRTVCALRGLSMVVAPSMCVSLNVCASECVCVSEHMGVNVRMGLCRSELRGASEGPLSWGHGRGAGVGLNECLNEHGPRALATHSPPLRTCAHVPWGSRHIDARGRTSVGMSCTCWDMTSL